MRHPLGSDLCRILKVSTLLQFTARPSSGNLPDIKRPNIVNEDTNVLSSETQFTELSDDKSHHVHESPASGRNLTEERSSEVNQQIKPTSTSAKEMQKLVYTFVYGQQRDQINMQIIRAPQAQIKMKIYLMYIHN